MIVELFAAVLLQADSVRVCTFDALTQMPLSSVTIRTRDSNVVSTSECIRLPAGNMVFMRPGYRYQSATIVSDTSILMSPLASLLKDTVIVRAAYDQRALGSGRITASKALQQGATAVSDMVALLPYTQLQEARGRSTLSLRGARREHTVVTLDGVVMNDPSTGIADLNELPLGAISAATVVPGTVDGAVGGVLALQSATTPFVLLRAGSFGERGAEGSGRLVAGGTVFNVGGAVSKIVNDFEFVNSAGASGAASKETRVNSDNSRSSLFMSALSQRWRLSANASRTDRGMVGAMNVRTYDNDRARTERLTTTGQLQFGDTYVHSAVRYLQLRYRDPVRPVLNSNATVRTATIGVSTRWRLLQFAAAVGADEMHATGAIEQSRVTANSSVTTDVEFVGNKLVLGVRADAVTDSRVVPSFNAAVARRLLSPENSWRGATVDLRARVSQAVRVPTLYDLYFSSPQRITVRALSPERVDYNFELGMGASLPASLLPITVDVALVSRRVRDAIIWFPGNFGWSPANVGREHMQGVEARAAVKMDSVNVDLWYSWYDSELTSGSLLIPVPYVPRSAGGIQTAVRGKVGTISGNARLTGARPFSAGPRDPNYELPSVILLDAAWSHPLSISRYSASLTMSVENIANVRWQSVRGFPEPARQWSMALHFTPSKHY